MNQILIYAGVFLIPTLLLVLWSRHMGKKVALIPLLWAGVGFAAYILLLKGLNYVPIPSFMEGHTLLWVGKSMSLLGTLTLIYFLPKVSFSSVGLKTNQIEGSVRPVLITAFIFLFMVSMTAMFLPPSRDLSLDNLLFQATMPGLDEEIFFRGVFLVLLNEAFGKEFRLWGANIGLGFWIVVLIFGLLHGVSVIDGQININFIAIISTGFTGFFITWMRERTGSLLIPILYHNLFNVTQALF